MKQDIKEKYKHLLKGMGISAGKGCIRFSKPGKINFEVIEKLSPGSFLHKAESAKMFSEANNHGWYGGKK